MAAFTERLMVGNFGAFDPNRIQSRLSRVESATENLSSLLSRLQSGGANHRLHPGLLEVIDLRRVRVFAV